MLLESFEKLDQKKHTDTCLFPDLHFTGPSNLRVRDKQFVFTATLYSLKFRLTFQDILFICACKCVQLACDLQGRH